MKKTLILLLLSLMLTPGFLSAEKKTGVSPTPACGSLENPCYDPPTDDHWYSGFLYYVCNAISNW